MEYFVSYYDYYQPEAYLSVTDTYIEKDLSINQEVDKLRLRATSYLLSGRRDIIMVASVSCIYGIGNPEDFHGDTIRIEWGRKYRGNVSLQSWWTACTSRTEGESGEELPGDRGYRGYFSGLCDYAYRVSFYSEIK